jgi:hypothetical protein
MTILIAGHRANAWRACFVQFQVSYNVVDRGNLNFGIESLMKTYLPGDHNTNINQELSLLFQSIPLPEVRASIV